MSRIALVSDNAIETHMVNNILSLTGIVLQGTSITSLATIGFATITLKIAFCTQISKHYILRYYTPHILHTCLQMAVRYCDENEGLHTAILHSLGSEIGLGLGIGLGKG